MEISMAEIKTYVCPNCGANTTNAQNCEYCGSLLVRFVDKGIDIKNTSYSNNNNVFPYLISALKQNIKFQDGRQPVATDISWDSHTISIISTSTGCVWGDGTPISSFELTKGLAIVVQIEVVTNPVMESQVRDNQKNIQKIKRFASLDSFPLFISHEFEYKDIGDSNYYCQEFALNFGEDIEGTARLVSEILTDVFRLNPSDKLDIETNAGRNAISEYRDTWRSHNDGCVIGFLIGLGSTAATIAAMF